MKRNLLFFARLNILFFVFCAHNVLSQTRILPHVTPDNASFETVLLLENQSEAYQPFILALYSLDGQSLGMVANTLEPNSTTSLTKLLMFGNTFAISHIVIASADPAVQFGISYQTLGGFRSVPIREMSVQARTWRFYPGNRSLVFDGLAFINMGSSPAKVTLRQFDFSGNLLVEDTINTNLEVNAKGLYLIAKSGPFQQCNDTLFELSGSEDLVVLALQGNSQFLWPNNTFPFSD